MKYHVAECTVFTWCYICREDSGVITAFYTFFWSYYRLLSLDYYIFWDAYLVLVHMLKWKFNLLSGLVPLTVSPAGGAVVPRVGGCSPGGQQRVSPSS